MSGVSDVTIMQSYTVKLLEKKIAAKDTPVFVLEKPRDFIYQAGQYVSLIVPQLVAANPREATRSMSLASAPSEDTLMIAMRMGPSAYKQALNAMRPNDTLEIRGPLGVLVPHAGDASAVYIAGGIGIAPFRGMILEQRAKGWPYPVTLMYANRYSEEAAFLAELQRLENERFKLIPIMTREEHWRGECTHCDAAMIKKYVDDIHASRYYIVGLPNMVTEVAMMLNEMGVDFERVKTELFTGY